MISLNRVLAAGLCGLVLLGDICVFSVAADEEKPQPNSVSPRDVRSRNFLLHTDLNDKDAEELVDRLENMLKLISAYWGRPNQKIIECFVVKDLKNWPPGVLSPAGLASIQNQAGVTATTRVTRGNRFDARSIVYAVADRGTPQHEAVHAYCGQTFGTTGPLWYSEGMAEMGQYWKPDDPAVNCHRVIVKYIHDSPPKSLNNIVNSQEVTGDSWQNYAWRWALCHLLANNPNYRQRFRPLGLGLLTGQRISFESTYGSMAQEISFEYKFFLQHFDIGYRADLVFWDWKAKFRHPRTTSSVAAVIKAKGGWQPSRCLVKAGTEYEYSATGEWKVGEDSELVDADGHEDGKGRLIGMLFDDESYELVGKPFELGVYGTWKAPADGQLVLRLNEPWKDINEENDGKLSFRIKFAGKGKPLTNPKKTSRTP